MSDQLSRDIFLALAIGESEWRWPVVYLATDALQYFVDFVLPEMNRRSAGGKFVLITGNADPGPLLCMMRHEGHAYDGGVNREWLIGDNPKKTAAMRALLPLLDSPSLLRWYAQNCDFEHPKLRCIPIGIDYHTMAKGNHYWGAQTTPREQDKLLQTMQAAALPWGARDRRAFVDFEAQNKWRTEAFTALRGAPPRCLPIQPAARGAVGQLQHVRLCAVAAGLRLRLPPYVGGTGARSRSDCD